MNVSIWRWTPACDSISGICIGHCSLCEKANIHAPTADVVEVVRCKDCVECEKRKTANQLPILYCKADKKLVHEKGFCSWGERREDGEIH